MVVHKDLERPQGKGDEESCLKQLRTTVLEKDVQKRYKKEITFLIDGFEKSSLVYILDSSKVWSKA